MSSRQDDRCPPPPRRRIALVVLVALVAAAPARASGQSALTKGSDQTFEVATWNIEWFGEPNNGPPDDARQVRNVASIIQQADIDLWALQEIADEAAFSTLMSELGDAYDSRIAPTSNQRGLALAFVFKPSVVQVRRVEEILTAFESDFAGRPPLQLEADISTGGAAYTATFIVVHMKATSDLDSYNQRVAASTRLKNHIDFTPLNSESVFVLGDLNDLLSGSIRSGQPSPYQNFVDDPAYSTPTRVFHSDGRNTFCFSSGCLSGSAIDHIILSNEVVPWYITDSADHFDELISEITSYVSTTSDHLPVFARFTLTSTGQYDVSMPESARVVATYPNPFYDALTVHYEISSGGPVVITLYDVLGRTVREITHPMQAAGTHQTSLGTGELPAGLYVIRVSESSGRSATATVAHL